MPVWEDALDTARKAGTSLGAVIEVEADGVPAGLGAPVYGKVDADLAAAMVGINAVKGVEIGAGFAAAAMSGDVSGDEIRMEEGAPPLSHQQCRRCARRHHHRPAGRGPLRGQAHELDPHAAPHHHGQGRGDRGLDRGAGTIPASASARCRWARAMMACVLADHVLRHRAQCG